MSPKLPPCAQNGVVAANGSVDGKLVPDSEVVSLGLTLCVLESVMIPGAGRISILAKVRAVAFADHVFLEIDVVVPDINQQSPIISTILAHAFLQRLFPRKLNSDLPGFRKEFLRMGFGSLAPRSFRLPPTGVRFLAVQTKQP